MCFSKTIHAYQLSMLLSLYCLKVNLNIIGLSQNKCRKLTSNLISPTPAKWTEVSGLRWVPRRYPYRQTFLSHFSFTRILNQICFDKELGEILHLQGNYFAINPFPINFNGCINKWNHLKFGWNYFYYSWKFLKMF